MRKFCDDTYHSLFVAIVVDSKQAPSRARNYNADL